MIRSLKQLGPWERLGLALFAVFLVGCTVSAGVFAGAGGLALESGSLSFFWVITGGLVAAMYSLGWPGEKPLARWLSLPLSDRQLSWRLTTGDRWAASLVAVLASTFALTAGLSRGWSAAEIAQAIVTPWLALAFAIPWALFLVRVGPWIAWGSIVVLVSLGMASYFPSLPPDIWAGWRFWTALFLCMGSVVGWGALGYLPGRSRLRRLAFDSGGTSAPAARSPGPVLHGRRAAIASLLLVDPDPYRRVRRVIWLVPIFAVTAWLDLRFGALFLQVITPYMFFVMMAAIGSMVVFGFRNLRHDRDVRTEARRLRIDPLPVSPREVLATGLSVRLPVLFAFLAFGLAAALHVGWDPVSRSLLILGVTFGTAFVAQVGIIELRGFSPQRPPVLLLDKRTRVVLCALFAVLALLPWAMVSGHLERIVEEIGARLVSWVQGSELLYWEDLWRELLDSGLVRFFFARPERLVAIGGVIFLLSSLGALRDALRAREERTTDIWP